MVGNHFRGSMHLCTHYCCTLPPIRHLESANEAMAPVFSNKFMDGDVFSHHICSLSLSLRQEKGGVTCHMTGVMCHLYRVTVSQQRNADTDTIRWS